MKKRDFADRTKENLRSKEFLQSKTDYTKSVITFVGLGGSGNIALHLLNAGLKRFNLIDFDCLEEGNLIRHLCGAKHIGNNKAISVKEELENRVGHEIKTIKAYTWNIFDEKTKFEEIVKKSDIIIVGTDTNSSRLYVNEICVKYNISAIHVSMFSRCSGGEVFTYIPGLACYSCINCHHGSKGLNDDYKIAQNKKDCSSSRDVKSAPGLGMDQGFLVSLAARKALEIIISKHGGNIPSIGGNYILLSIFGIPPIPEPLTSESENYHIHVDCYICSSNSKLVGII